MMARPGGTGARDQGLADAALAKRQLHRERPEQQRLGLADADRRQPHRADQQRTDVGGERQIDAGRDALVACCGISSSTAPLCIAERPENANIHGRSAVIGGMAVKRN